MPAKVSFNRSLPTLLSRNPVEVLTLLYLLFIVQLSLIPYDLQLGRAGGDVFSEPWSARHPPDVAANLMLYVPLGWLLHAGLARRLHSRWSACLLSVTAAFGLSLSMEVMQGFSPSRVSSLADVATNAVGAALGNVLACGCGWLLPRLLGALIATLYERPQVALLQVYLVVLVFVGALPFLFCLDGGHLKNAVRDAYVVPFASDATWTQRADKALKDDDQYAYAMFAHTRMWHWSAWAAEAASFALLAWLMYPVWRTQYGWKPLPAAALTCWCGGLLALGLSVMQLFILTRGFDATDVLMRGLGLVGGLLLHARYATSAAKAEATRTGGPLARVICIAAAGFVLFNGLIPFVPDSDGSLLRAIATPAFRPLQATYTSRFDLMTEDLVSKFAAYAVLGATLATALPWVAQLSRARRVWLAAGVAALLSSMLEVAQAYIMPRVPSLTDVLLAAVACPVGVLAQAQFRAMREFVAAQPPLPSDRPWTPTDELIHTLTEPYAAAPKEVPLPRTQHPSQT
ncbi:MAG TPA: VanZ family protein [Phycisphaerae bacterium]|nr:VanZ family protein [Phycisphaerae bacterium]HNU46263.1 VanZ family protein [Phycisphaerae bacterium]